MATKDKQDSNSQSGSGKNTIAIVATIIILCIIGFLVWLLGWSGVVNGNNYSNNSTNSSQQSKTSDQAAESEIKSNWESFFNGKTATGERVTLLQNGQQFAPIVGQLSSTKTAQATSATVTKVAVNGKTAIVSYSIDVNGQPALTNQTGQAVLVNGTWKVSSTAFCGLLQLYGNVPPNCPKASGSQSQSQTQASQSQTPQSQPATKPNSSTTGQ